MIMVVEVQGKASYCKNPGVSGGSLLGNFTHLIDMTEMQCLTFGCLVWSL